MDPALQELIESGPLDEPTAIVVRLFRAGDAPPGLTVVSSFGDVVTARAPRGRLADIRGDPRVASLKAPRWLGVEDDVSLLEEELDDLQIRPTDIRRPEGIAQRGEGIVLGLVDWGCDFVHPDFRRDDGSTRLAALWDQSARRADGNRFGYGRIHSAARISQALASADPYAALGYRPTPAGSTKPAHGTHVMGIAAGNGRAGGPEGIAPAANLAFVHLAAGSPERDGALGDSATLLEALDWLREVAAGRPLVINLSIGRHAGSHDGTSPVELAIDWLIRSRPGIAVVQSTGNYHGRGVHTCGRLRSGARADLSFEVDAADTSPNEVDAWYDGRDRCDVLLAAPGGVPSWRVALGSRATLEIGGRRIGTLYHRDRDPNNGDHQVNLFLYEGAPPGRWSLELEGRDIVDGRYHAWIERDPACRRCQAFFVPHLANDITSTGSVCNGLYPIVVGAYDGHSPAQRPLARFSSQGPTRDGRTRPLLLAPGVRVLSARSTSREPTAPPLARMSGTSMAAPHVSGAVALMLQAGGAMPIEALRRLLWESLLPASVAEADRDRCGFGYLDVTRAVAGAAAHTPPTEYIDSEATMPCNCPNIESTAPEFAEALETAPGAFEGESDAERSTWHPVEWGDSLVTEGEHDAAAFLARLLQGPQGGGVAAPVPGAMPSPGDLFHLASQAGARGLQHLAHAFGIVATPGSIMPTLVQAGDVLLRHLGGSTAHAGVVAHPHLYRSGEARAHGLDIESDSPGFYAMVVEPGAQPHGLKDRFARRVAGADGRTLPDTVVLRPQRFFGQPIPPSFGEDDTGAGGSSNCPDLRHFGFDSAALTGAHRVRIGEIARQILAAHPGAITVIGFASTEGPVDYNLALGRRRADAVAATLRSALDHLSPGSGSRITIDAQSQGEGQQVVGGAGANRRVAVCFAQASVPRQPPQPRPSPCPSVTLWINAFIPRTIPGVTSTLAAGPLAGSTILCPPVISPLVGCFLTDQRSFSNSIPTVTQRMRSMAEVRLVPPALLGVRHSSSPTIGVDASSGAPGCRATASGGTRRFHSFVTSPAPGGATVIRLSVEGSDNNPCSPGTPDIDYTGTFVIHVRPATGQVEVAFEGLVDGFPAYEAYARIGTVTQTLFNFGPAGAPLSLFGSADQPVRGRAVFSCPGLTTAAQPIVEAVGVA